MKQKNTITEKRFMSLTDEQQTQELKKLTKRANVRLSLLEEKDTINMAYRQAYQYNINEDRDKNRFSEKSKYKDKDEKLKTFEAVTTFLKNQNSTLKGVEAGVTTKIKDMIKENQQIDVNIINKMSDQEKKYAVKYIAQASNKKLEKLEKQGITQYAYSLAEFYNNPKGEKGKQNRFDTKAKQGDELNSQIENISFFYNAKTSTKKGWKESVKKRMDTFAENEVIIPKQRTKQFFDFLASEEFTNLGATATSNQIIETYNEARDKKMSAKKLMEKFREYLDRDITFDVLQEELGVAKWREKKEEDKPKHKFTGRK